MWAAEADEFGFKLLKTSGLDELRWLYKELEDEGIAGEDETEEVLDAWLELVGKCCWELLTEEVPSPYVLFHTSSSEGRGGASPSCWSLFEKYIAIEERCDRRDIRDIRLVYIWELRIVWRRTFVPASGKYSWRLSRFLEICILSGLRPWVSVKLFRDLESLVSELYPSFDLWRAEGCWADKNFADEPRLGECAWLLLYSSSKDWILFVLRKLLESAEEEFLEFAEASIFLIICLEEASWAWVGVVLLRQIIKRSRSWRFILWQIVMSSKSESLRTLASLSLSAT